jgi:prevent-host-death family protein
LRVEKYRVFYGVRSNGVAALGVLSRTKKRSFTKRPNAMKTIPIYEAKNQLSKYVEICREEPVVITKNGQMKAFLVPYDEDEFAVLMLQYSRSFRKMMEKRLRAKYAFPLWKLRGARGRNGVKVTS